jgi:glucose/arabinose dehydrogenase
VNRWTRRPRARGILTALALAVGTVLGAGVLIAGGILVREGAVRDFAEATDLVAYPVQAGLRVPSVIAFAPGGEMIVAETAGTISVFENGEQDARRVAVSTVPDVGQVRKSGLLGLVLDRDFASNRYLYACAARHREEGRPRVNQLLRLTADDAWNITVDAVLAELGRARPDRNGCAVGVDPAGDVWVGVGDARDPRAVFDDQSILGKVLRIPADLARGPEPLGEVDVRSRIVATGVRDPRTLALAADGALHVADGGPEGADDIDELVLEADYGWPCAVGTEPEPAPPRSGAMWELRCSEREEARRTPEWSTPAGARTGIGGMVFLAGERWGPWDGALIIGAGARGELLLLERTDEGFVESEALFGRSSWRPGAMTLGPDGSLFVAVTTGGSNAQIMRIAPSD